jgi:uncharacterized protein with von Willebrand factor type A (vWA) domain
MEAGALPDNILHFARALRAAGLPVGTGAALDAISAVEVAGVRTRADFRAALACVLVKKREHLVVFDQAFDLFWRARGLHDGLLALLSAQEAGADAQTLREKPAPAQARLAEAFGASRAPQEVETLVEADRRLTASDEEALRAKDFAQMSAQEIGEAARAVAALALAGDERPTRRLGADPRGARLDPRRMFRSALRPGGAMKLPRRGPRVRKPPLVALCDISGSMSDYSRVFLHFLHALALRRAGVQVFLFGTRLTNVTRALRHRDVDEALALCAQEAQDWSGGTRIGACLHAFNRDWSRRALGQGATVLLFTDGLEREGVEELRHESERLSKSCRRLIWLNPLLRFDRYEPRQRGVRAILPFVDEFRPVHNLDSVAALVAALGDARAPRAAADPRLWLKRAG